MLSFSIIHFKVFSIICDIFKTYVDELVFFCTPENIIIECMDKSHISVLNIQLNKSLFTHFNCLKNTKFVIHINYLMGNYKLHLRLHNWFLWLNLF